VIQISVQIFRIQNNEDEDEAEAEAEVTPRSEAVKNDHACNASHGLSSSHEKLVSAKTGDVGWQSFEKFLNTKFRSDQVGNSHQFLNYYRLQFFCLDRYYYTLWSNTRFIEKDKAVPY